MPIGKTDLFLQINSSEKKEKKSEEFHYTISSRGYGSYPDLCGMCATGTSTSTSTSTSTGTGTGTSTGTSTGTGTSKSMDGGTRVRMGEPSEATTNSRPKQASTEPRESFCGLWNKA